MRPKFLLDECVEAVLLDLIVMHNHQSAQRVEAIRVGDRADLPLGTSDPDMLRWAENNGYIIVSRDVSTLRTHFGDHLAAGGHCPGLFLIRASADCHAVVELLAVASDSDDPWEWRDLMEFI
jgi:hypothetical protein